MVKKNLETKVQDKRNCESVSYPKKIGKYRVVREINRGGMGIVLEAINDKLKQKVAVKILPEALFSRNRYARFKREAKTMASIRHNNIARVFDFGEQNGFCYLVMDFIEGENLENYLIKNTPSYNELLDISIKTAKIISDLSSMNILHRDIKPSNIMISGECNVILVDFGICFNSYDDNNKDERLTKEPVGTPVYMAPERLMGECGEGNSVRADIYSLGVMMYRMFTGTLPFSGATCGEVTKEILQGKIKTPRDINPKISRSLEYVIMKAISLKEEQRYEDAKKLSSDISDVRSNKGSFTFLLKHFVWGGKRLLGNKIFWLIILTVLSLFLYYKVQDKLDKSRLEWSNHQLKSNTFDFKVFRDLEGETKVKANEQFISYDRTRNKLVWLRNQPGFIIAGKASESDYALDFKTSALRTNEVIGAFISSSERLGGYILKIEDMSVSLCRNYYGNVIKQIDFNTADNMHLRIERTGAEIRVFIDKKIVISFMDYSPVVGKDLLCYGFFFNQGFRTLKELKFETPKKPLMISPLVLGQRFYELGMLDNALAEYQKLLNEYPEDEISVAASLRTGMILREQGKIDLSINQLEQVMNEYLDSELQPEIIFQYGRSLYEGGFTNKAERFFLQGLSRYVESEVRLNIFMFMQEKLAEKVDVFTRKDIERISAEFRFLIDNFPENRPLLALSAKKLTNHFIQLSEDNRALLLLDEFHEFFPKQQSTLAWACITSGRLYLKRSDFSKAEVKFMHVLEHYAGLGVYEKWALEGLIKVYYLSKDLQKEKKYRSILQKFKDRQEE